MTKFIGTGVALITPFKEDLSIDFDALERLVEYNIENGTVQKCTYDFVDPYNIQH